MPQIIPLNVQESPQTVPLGTEQVRRGIDGITPDIRIGTVTTLPAGSDATASITGTKEEPVLNFGIPQGEAGEVSQEEFDALEEAFEDLRDYVYDMSPLATVTAPVVAVSDAAPLDAKNVTIKIEPVQSGSGTPAPDNVRPISGWTGANVNYGADQTDYDTLSISWQTEAGTVYGGTLDLTEGTLTVTHARVNLYDKTWTAYTSGNPNGSTFNAPFSGVTFKAWTLGGSITAMSNALAPNPSGAYYDAISNSFWWNNASDGLRCCYGLPNDQTSLAKFTQFLTDNQVIIVGELATPQTYDLDPVVITMLRGANTLWSDTGDTTLTYRQDVALVLQALTAPDETDMRANTNYAVNSFFQIGGQLYKATSAIATGETIRPGTNCTATTIAEQLTYLYSQI